MRNLLIFTVLCSLSACIYCEDCPSPPNEFKFQVVDVLDRDLTRGSNAMYNSNDIRMTFWEYNLEHDILLKQDTFGENRTIFSVSYMPNMVERGISKFAIHLDTKADTLRVDMSFVKTYCCEYSLYKKVSFNNIDLEYVPGEDYVFSVVKR